MLYLFCWLVLIFHVDAVGSGTSKMLWLLLNSTKIILLVVSYAMANILAYYALARVDAAVYTVMLQVGKRDCSIPKSSLGK